MEKLSAAQKTQQSIGKHLPWAMFINFLLVIASHQLLGNEWWLIILAILGYSGFEYWQKTKGGNNPLKQQFVTVLFSVAPYIYYAVLISDKYF